MIKNLLKTAFRSIVRDKGYSLLNVLGLTIGITSSIFLFLYILDELSYDQYHENKKNIYRVITHIKEVDDEFTWVVAQIPFAPTVRDKYPEVTKVVRFFGTGRALFEKGDKSFYEEDIMVSDSAIFEVFSYNFIQGNPETALHEPYSIVLTKDLAIKYFGTELALGEDLQNGEDTYKVTGVIENVPKNSHFSFDGLISLASMSEQRQQGNWGSFGVATYLYAPQLDDPKQLQDKLPEIYDEFCAPIFEQYGIKFTYELQRIVRY